MLLPQQNASRLIRIGTFHDELIFRNIGRYHFHIEHGSEQHPYKRVSDAVVRYLIHERSAKNGNISKESPFVDHADRQKKRTARSTDNAV